MFKVTFPSTHINVLVLNHYWFILLKKRCNSGQHVAYPIFFDATGFLPKERAVAAALYGKRKSSHIQRRCKPVVVEENSGIKHLV